MHAIPLHHRETRCHPFRQAFAILAAENGLMPNIIDDVRKVDAAATLMGVLKQSRDIWPFHESVPGRRAPELRGSFSYREAAAILNPRNRLRLQCENEQAFMERSVSMLVDANA